MKNLKRKFENLLDHPEISIGDIFHWLKRNKKITIFSVLILALWFSIIFLGNEIYRDEAHHYKQIKRFYSHKIEIIETLTTLPGYHAIIAIPTLLMTDISILGVKILSLFFSILIIPVFLLISKKTLSRDPVNQALLSTLLPIAFVYYPLIYTDIFSALLVLLSFYLSLKKKYHWAAIISILSILVRQQNIIWHLFIWAYLYISIYGFSFSYKNILNYLRSNFGFLIGLILFFIFVKLNGGIAIGDKKHHHIGLYMGNIYFFLFLAGILFWPIVITKLFEWKKIFKNRFFWLSLILATAISILLFLYPPALHGYNYDSRFIRNIFLTFIYKNHLFIYASLVFLGTLSLFSIKLRESKNYLIYPFTVLCLLPSWLIEQRYTIIPFMFILLFRKEWSLKTEKFMQIYFLILSASLTIMIIKTKLFL